MPSGIWGWGAVRRLGTGCRAAPGNGCRAAPGGWVLSGPRGVWVGADRRLEQLLEGGGGDLSERCVNDTANPGLGLCAHSVI